MTGPYGQTALQYWAAGWHGVIPLPANDKYPPPRGFTGAGALMPSYADVYAWAEGNEGNGNIGLRFPPGLIGIDVDAYGEKMGGVTFAEKLSRWRPLPDTWRISSRTDGLSGIYLYRVPEGLRWPGTAGPGIDIIENRYRYAVTWPSVHPNGNHYEWHRDDALYLDKYIPGPDDFPPLPETWVQGLTHGQSVTDIVKAELTDASLWQWLQSRPNGQPCSEMAQSAIRINQRLLELGYSRHDTMMTGVMHLAHLSAEGHIGLDWCLSVVRERFLSVATIGTDARSPEAAEREWHRALSGAVGVALADDGLLTADTDPCVAPLGAAPPLSGPVRHADMIESPTRHDQAGPGVTDWQDAAEGIFGPDGLVVREQGIEIGSALDPREETLVDPALDSFLVEGSSVVKSAPIDRTFLLLRVDEEILRQDARDMARDIRETRKGLRDWRIPESVNLDTAIERDPVLWSIEDVLPANSNLVLTAQYKTGKTTLVLNLARCLADEEKFLDLYPVVPFDGRITLWNYEVNDSMFVRWAKSQGIRNEHRITMLNLRGYSVPLHSPIARKWAIEHLRSNNVAVWVVDPFARAMQGDENSNDDVHKFLTVFDEIKEEAGVKVGIVVTHTGRSDTASDRSRGATRLDDWPDVRWLLSSDDDRFRYFAATGRDVETVPGRLSFDPLSRRLSMSGESKPGKMRPGKRNLADEILGTVKTAPGLGIRAITDAVRARHSDVIETVRILEQHKRLIVVRQGEGKAMAIYLPEQSQALDASR